jgi:hypothetical protein
VSGRHITMVAHLLGREAPLAKHEFRKGLGPHLLGRLEENLKVYGLLDELAWKIKVRIDPRRVLQDEIEQRIHELNRPGNLRQDQKLAYRGSRNLHG